MAEFFLFMVFSVLVVVALLLWSIIDILIDIRYTLTDWWLKSIKQSKESQEQTGKK